MGRVAAVDASCIDWGVSKAVIADVRSLKSWVESREMSFAQAVAKVSSFPEKSLAEAAKISLRNGERFLQACRDPEAVRSRGIAWMRDGCRASTSMC